MSDLKPLPETISVVIPCYQQGHFLGAAIESVLAQTCPAAEIIVVDDGSTDDTATVAARYPSVRYIHQDNAGPATARNRGISASSGNYNALTLKAITRILRSQFSLIKGNKQYEEACQTGMRNFRGYYYGQAIRQLRSFVRTGKHRTRALQNIKVILRFGPRMLALSARERLG